MADIRTMTFSEWGIDSFCIQDYIGYVEDIKASMVDTENERIATLTLYNEDAFVNAEAFIKLCRDARHVTLFVIEFAFLDDGRAAHYWEKVKEMVESYGDYVDLESYETKLAFGLKGDRR